jgi:predicted nucleic acid-binding Zn ribbon protein
MQTEIRKIVIRCREILNREAREGREDNKFFFALLATLVVQLNANY